MFVVNVATSAALPGSTVGLVAIGVFHGLPDEYGAAQAATVQVTDAGLEVNPLFVASTENVCDPLARPEYAAGELHPAYADPSNEHTNDDPA